jgi:hypothetical protein
MTSHYRGAWDSVANPKSAKEFAVDTAESTEIGDLMWWDKRFQVARPFGAASTWTGSTAGTQGKVAENFIGVARSAFTVGDPKALVRIEARGVYRLPVTTAALFEVGDLVTASKDPSGNLLFDQEVEKAALGDPGEPTVVAQTLAIGRAAKRSVSAVNVIEVEIHGTREAGANFRMYLSS